MLAEFQEYIQGRYPALKERKFLLACSGGLDSTVLAHLCHRAGLQFVLAHCNFNLRGAESDQDEGFVRELANTLGVQLFVTHFDTMDYVYGNQVSIEMAARELRYAWFAELMKESDLEILVTAHHSDDSLETFLINLSRGTGITGLKGIPSSTVSVVRPLLPFSRSQLLEFAKTEGFTWREDSSNQETVHLRNKIRLEVVPKLKELHPTFLNNFQKTQSHLSGSAKMLEDYIRLLKSKLFLTEENYIRISIDDLLQLEPIGDYLHALFDTYGFKAWKDIEGLLHGMSGKEVHSKTHRLVRDRAYLLLSELGEKPSHSYLIHEGVSEIKVPIHLMVSEVSAIGLTSKNILYVDKSSLKYPLIVRNWKKGDYFYPFGMVGKKKVSKFFKDEKVDMITKEKQWLVCSGEDIVWIVGQRADNRFKVSGHSKNILRFTYVK
ncbi:MAG: tRNA lysidine(34) synthetase TilS [Maribacter sp.]